MRTSYTRATRLVAAAGPGAELREFQNHGRGHIVHDIKAHILQERKPPCSFPPPDRPEIIRISNADALLLRFHDADFRLQPDARLLQHRRLHLLDQSQDIRRRWRRPG